MKTLRYLVLALLLLAGTAQARIVFATSDFPTSQFRNLDKAMGSCGGEGASFLCGLRDATLTLIPTKGVDYLFDDAGELVAAFAKVQKGQNYKDYALDNRTNLIPADASVPGLAVLIDGSYRAPENAKASWSKTGDTEIEGTFSYTAGDVHVERQMTVSAVRETLQVSVTVTPATAAGAGPSAGGATPGTAAASGGSAAGAPSGAATVQLAVPGIGNTAEPTVKIGHDGDFTLAPAAGTSYAQPSYAALQNNNNNTGDAIILEPAEGSQGVAAEYLRPNMVALTAQVGQDGTAALSGALYTGRNELIRYVQEGYLDLPGLFRPNILGRLSLVIVRILQFIHQYVGSWGLSIIVLTLMFRALIWPLIATQTKSMFGMQKLQPKIQELQKKYKDDREKLTQETMKLYQEAGVNPAGGCLPILLQMPLFIILWRVFVNFEFNQGFLWLPDLGQADPYYILPALYVAVMVATSWFSARGNPQTLRQSMFINLIFVIVIINFPAGVLVYYVVSMLVQVLQYWMLSRDNPAPAVAAPVKRGKRG